MECTICNCKCIIPTSAFAASSSNILVENADGTIICSACFDAKEFASNVVKSKTTSTSNTKVTPNKVVNNNANKKVENKSQVYYNCLKCKNSFSGPVCSCGFANPLYRRK